MSYSKLFGGFHDESWLVDLRDRRSGATQLRRICAEILRGSAIAQTAGHDYYQGHQHASRTIREPGSAPCSPAGCHRSAPAGSYGTPDSANASRILPGPGDAEAFG